MLHACFSFYIAPALADMSDFIEFLHEVFAGFGDITTRRMFGAQSAYDAALRAQEAKDRHASAPPWRKK